MLKSKFFYNTTLFLSLLLSCLGAKTNTVETETPPQIRTKVGRDFRNDMRSFVMDLSSYAKGQNPDFAILPQNGIELVTATGSIDGTVMTDYLAAIDGHGQENLHYGYTGDNQRTSKDNREYLTSLLKISQERGNTILVIDYCSSEAKIRDAYQQNHDKDFIPFIALDRDLTTIPTSYKTLGGQNDKNIGHISDASNFLFFLNYENYATKDSLLSAISNTDYDLIIIDLFFNNGQIFSKEDIARLKTKSNGSRRLVFCYMSIGEAEDYRYYWEEEWETNPPSWLDKENKKWKGNFKVKYWNPDWQSIVRGSENAYLDKILAHGFDGVYLDIIDAFEYFETEK